MMRFDRDRWPPRERHAFNYIRIQRPLCEEIGPTNLFSLSIKHVDKQASNRLAFGFRIRNASKLCQKKLFCINMNQRNIIVIFKERYDLFSLRHSQQPMVDKHARQLITNRLMNQHGSHCRVDAA